jgi:hypothetical protein
VIFVDISLRATSLSFPELLNVSAVGKGSACAELFESLSSEHEIPMTPMDTKEHKGTAQK